MHDALELNNRELTHSRKGSVDTDHWAFCIGDDFIPVQIDTMIHSAFKSGCFSVDSIFEPSVCVNRTLKARRSQKIQDIEAIQQIPMLQEWCALLDLGFVPLCMAGKLGELQRQGACANKLIAFKVSQSEEEHEIIELFQHSCYSGRSKMGRVVYRGNDWEDACQSDGWEFIAVGKLLLSMQCYPALCHGLPIGIRVAHNHFFRISNQIKYGYMSQKQSSQKQDTYCLFLVAVLLCYDSMFFHTQHSYVRPDGKVVPCPFRVGGSGDYGDPYATFTASNLFNFALDFEREELPPD